MSTEIINIDTSDVKYYFANQKPEILKKIKMTKRSIYESTPIETSAKIGKLITGIFGNEKITLVEPCASIGGDTIGLSLALPEGSTIRSFEIDKTTFECLKQNILAFSPNQHFITENADFLEKKIPNSDVLYLDPPFGDETFAGHVLYNKDKEVSVVDRISEFCDKYKLVVFKHSRRAEEKSKSELKFEDSDIVVKVVKVLKQFPGSKKTFGNYNLAFITKIPEISKKFEKLPKEIIGSSLPVTELMKKYNIKYS